MFFDPQTSGVVIGDKFNSVIFINYTHGGSPYQTTYESSGKLLLSGMSSIRTGATVNAVGRLTVNGLSQSYLRLFYTSSGILNFNGLAEVAGIYSYNASGKKSFIGVSSNQLGILINMLGKLQVNGLAVTEYTIITDTYDYNASGRILTVGLALERTGLLYATSGTLIQFSGTMESLEEELIILDRSSCSNTQYFCESCVVNLCVKKYVIRGGLVPSFTLCDLIKKKRLPCSGGYR